MGHDQALCMKVWSCWFLWTALLRHAIVSTALRIVARRFPPGYPQGSARGRPSAPQPSKSKRGHWWALSGAKARRTSATRPLARACRAGSSASSTRFGDGSSCTGVRHEHDPMESSAHRVSPNFGVGRPTVRRGVRHLARAGRLRPGRDPAAGRGRGRDAAVLRRPHLPGKAVDGAA
jgi:hypothetical protein